MFKLLDQAATGKLIDSIQRAGKKLDNDIQTALQCSAIHAHEHGDISLIERLLAALPKGVRSNAAKEWLAQYAPVAFVEKGLQFSRPYDSKDNEARAVAVQACIDAAVWTELKPEPPFKPFVMEQALDALLKKAEAALQDSEHQHSVTEEQVAKLKALKQALA